MTALELGYILHHKYGQSVLLVDNDKQGNLSQAMGKHYAEDHICGTAQLLNGQDVNKIMRLSRPARALWIEIHLPCPRHQSSQVEAREGLVD